MLFAYYFLFQISLILSTRKKTSSPGKVLAVPLPDSQGIIVMGGIQNPTAGVIVYNRNCPELDGTTGQAAGGFWSCPYIMRVPEKVGPNKWSALQQILFLKKVVTFI